MKKKFLGLLAVIVLSLGVSNSAIAVNPQYDAEITALRRAKNAQVQVINKQIKSITAKIESDTLDTDMSEEQKSKNLKQYQDELYKLEQKKADIQAKYNATKKEIKSKYKYGGLINLD